VDKLMMAFNVPRVQSSQFYRLIPYYTGFFIENCLIRTFYKPNLCGTNSVNALNGFCVISGMIILMVKASSSSSKPINDT